MDEKIYNLAKSLNESLNDKEEVKRLNELEKELNDSYEVFKLSYEKDETLNTYSRLKEIYGEDDPRVIGALKEAKEAKEKLSNFPLVKEYLAQYSKVRDLYMEIDNILFSDLRKGKC